jgi:NADH-quinone oxidoreductase subunit M
MSFELVTNHLLTWMILVPAVASLALLATEAFGGLPPIAWRAVGLATALVNLGLGGLLYTHFDPTRTGYHLVDYAPWIVEYGIHYYVGIDGISLPMVLLTVFLVPVSMVASWSQVERAPRSFVFFLLVLESAMVGAFSSLNLFQFYVYLEVMLVPMYFLIGVWGEERRIEAAVRFFIFSMLGSVLMLLAILALAYLGFQQLGVWTFDLVPSPWSTAPGLLEIQVGNAGPWWQTQFWLFAAFALAFAIRILLVPFHGWLPAAQVESPTAGSVLLAGVFLKVGAYALLRFALPLFPVAALEWTPFILSLSVVGILYGSLLALVQEDIKRLVAYGSLAQLGFVVLGIFAKNLQGMNGSVLQMVNHGLSTGALFILVGMLQERRGTREISELGGIARPMPIFAFFFVLVGLSSIGMPPLNGFVGELLILLGAFRASPTHAALATTGVVFAAAYMLWMLRRVLLGPIENAENRKLIDLDWREKSVLVALCIPIVAIGIYPSPLLRRIEPSVSDLLQQIETRQTIVSEVEASPLPGIDLKELR